MVMLLDGAFLVYNFPTLFLPCIVGDLIYEVPTGVEEEKGGRSLLPIYGMNPIFIDEEEFPYPVQSR